MGLLKFLKDSFANDCMPEKIEHKKLTAPKRRNIVNIDEYKIDFQPKRKHPNYYKVKDLIMRCVIANIDTALSCRELAELIDIGKSSVNRQLRVLQSEGIVRKQITGNSSRSITYKIQVNKDDAILYRDLFTSGGRKKSKI